MILRSEALLSPVQHLSERQHFSEYAGGFGKGQRSRGQHLALIGGEYLMHAVAQFMRQRHHVARFAKVIQHHVGVDSGDGRVGEGAGGLAGLYACVDPAFVEERLRQLRQFGRKCGVGVGDGLPRLFPADDPVGFHR